MAEIENPAWREAREKITSSNRINFYDRNKGQFTLNNKLLNELKEKAEKNVQSIKTRNAWLEAAKRKNYIHEYDRLKGHIDTILNKDRNAIGIYALKKRRDDLIQLAHQSVNWQKENKHEIYKKADEIEKAKSNKTSNEGRVKQWTCPVCHKTMPYADMIKHTSIDRKHQNYAFEL